MSANTLQEIKQKVQIYIRKTFQWTDASKAILQKDDLDLSITSHVEDCEDSEILYKTCFNCLSSTDPLGTIYLYSISKFLKPLRQFV